MLGPSEISAWHWVGFIIGILVLLALDLGVYHKRAHVVRFREACGWTAVWMALALAFAALLAAKRGKEEALEFVTGYLIEFSLSMDNVFVIALIFSYFRVPLQFQHRVLFWGILGALIMRGVMIGLGATLIAHAHWVMYLFGLFLIASGFKMIVAANEQVRPEKNPLIRLAQKLFPVSSEFDGQNFVTRLQGKPALTPLVLVLLMVETTDLVFALDSIPAIFAVTEKAFIIFTSNVFAILGLRSLYFVLAGAIGYFRFLKLGLSVVLVFIGLKMLLAKQYPMPTEWSLAVVGGIIGLSMVVSVIVGWWQRRRPPAVRGS
jgi:tellurite resistance protein TerC